MSNLEQSISDAILQSVDILVDKKISELNYSQTIKGLIVDDIKASKGVYEVKYESSTFTAYTSDTTLKNGDLVQVLISSNDSSETRVIINKIVVNDEDYLSNNEFLNYIKATDNLIDSMLDSNKRLVANSEIEENLLWSYAGTQKFEKYSRISLEAEFQTLLQNATSGSYGLRLELTHDESVTNLTFDSNEMIGNPLYYINYNNQRKIFDLTKYNISKITNISLYFYQEKGSFKIEDGSLIAYKDSFNNNIPANILVDNINLTFGFLKDEFTLGVDSVNIQLADGYSLSYDVEPEKSVVELKWLHWNEDNTQLLNNEEISKLEGYSIRWYQYKIYSEAVKVIEEQEKSSSGPFLGMVSGSDQAELLKENLISNLGCPYLNDNNWQPIMEYNNSFYCEVPLDGDSSTHEQVKAIVFFNDMNFIESNTITFTNENEVIESDSVQQKKGLYLTTNDGLKGNYYLYTESGILNHEDKKTRVLKAQYYTADGEEVNLIDNENYQIEWTLPEENSMLSSVKIGNDQSEVIFCIDDNYKPLATNNSITCNIKYQNEDIYNEYTKTFNFYFGYANTSNEGLNLVITFEENIASRDAIHYAKNAIEFGNTEETFIIKKFDSNGVAVQLTEEKIEWSAILYNVSTGELLGTIKEENGIIDINNEQSEDENNSEQSEEENNNAEQSEDENNEEDNNNVALSKIILRKNDGFNFDYLIYLKATFKNSDGNELYSIEYPVAITKDIVKYNYITGTTFVIYKQMGAPFYNKEPYNVYNYNMNLCEENIIWAYPDKFDNWYMLNTTDNTFLPSQVYLQEHGAIGIEAYNETKTIQQVEKIIQVPINQESEEDEPDEDDDEPIEEEPTETYEEQIVIENQEVINRDLIWLQPISISQTSFSSQIINKWDGKSVSTEGSAVLAPMIAAGKKENDKFTGVIMGDWAEETNNVFLNTGLYGFKEGVTTFGLKDDGTAYFGKSGNGQILIDGNNSWLTSQNYLQYINKYNLNENIENYIFPFSTNYEIKSGLAVNPGGIFLDLDDSVLDIRNGLYYLTLNASNNNTDDISKCPLKIGTGNDPKFTVDWGGNLKAINAFLQDATLKTAIIKDNNDRIRATFNQDGLTLKQPNGNQDVDTALFRGDGMFIRDNNGIQIGAFRRINGTIGASFNEEINQTVVPGNSITVSSLSSVPEGTNFYLKTYVVSSGNVVGAFKGLNVTFQKGTSKSASYFRYDGNLTFTALSQYIVTFENYTYSATTSEGTSLSIGKLNSNADGIIMSINSKKIFGAGWNGNVSTTGAYLSGGRKIIIRKTFSKSDVSFSSESSKTVWFDIGVTGYTPIGIIGFNINGSGTGDVAIRSAYIDMDLEEADLEYYNFGNQVTAEKVNVSVLYLSDTQY